MPSCRYCAKWHLSSRCCWRSMTSNGSTGPTAGCLSFALRRSRASPIGLLASARSGAGALPVLSALGSEEVEELAVGPLSPEEIETMLVQRAPGLQRRAIVRVAKQSGGNPFYALEIARAVATLGGNAGPGPLPVPGEPGDLLKARVARLPARAREALLAATCLDNPSSSLVDVNALGPAEEAGLIEVDRGGRTPFTHPLGSPIPNVARYATKRLENWDAELHRKGA